MGINILNFSKTKKITPLKRKFCTHITPTFKEVHMADHEIIVSKTDIGGNVTYANKVFLRLANVTESEIIGAPHSLIRHPDMPRCVFKLLWDRLQEKQEVFAYVVNFAANGDHYWVFAHVTPSFDSSGNVVGYHSNRRKPCPKALEAIKPLYAELLNIEKSASNAKAGLEESFAALVQKLNDGNIDYDRFIFSLSA